MFTYINTLWHQLQCPTPQELLEDAYNLPNAEDAIAYLEKWIPFLSEYNEDKFWESLSYDLLFFFEKDTYSDKLFHWMQQTSSTK